MSPASPIRTILVAHDFSEHSDAALETAVELARGFGAVLHLVHSYAIPIHGVMPYEFAVPDGVWDGIREAAGRRLDEIRGKVEAEGLEVSSELSPELPSEAVVKCAAERGADLIVMGTRGLSGLKHVVLGSVAERTLRDAPCPVLTVKGG